VYIFWESLGQIHTRFFLQNVVVWDGWVQARHVRPRDSMWWKTFAPFEAVGAYFRDAIHTNKHQHVGFVSWKETVTFVQSRVLNYAHNNVRRKDWMWHSVACVPVPSHPLSATESIYTPSFSVGMCTSFAGSSGLECGESFKDYFLFSERRRIFEVFIKKNARAGANFQFSKGNSATARHTSTPKKGKSKPLSMCSAEFTRFVLPPHTYLHSRSCPTPWTSTLSSWLHPLLHGFPVGKAVSLYAN